MLESGGKSRRDSTSLNSEWRHNQRSTCASFSSSSRLHVLYTIRPPDSRWTDAASRSFACLSQAARSRSGEKRQRASGRRRMTPVFVHGTSNKDGVKPHRWFFFCDVAFHYDDEIPFQPRDIFAQGVSGDRPRGPSRREFPVPRINSAICIVLPPGAAQASSTISPGWGFRSAGATEVEGSWT